MAWLSPRDVTADDADRKLAIRTTCLADPFTASPRAVDGQRCNQDRWPPQARTAVVLGTELEHSSKLFMTERQYRPISFHQLTT